MSQSVPDRCCLNCHFLVGIPASGYHFSAGKMAREALRKMIANIPPLNETDNIHIRANYTCDRAIWVAIKISDFCELIKDRRKSCPFFPYKDGLNDLSKAEELQRTEAHRREAEHDRKWAKWGVWIAAIALILNLGWSIWQRFNPPNTPAQKAALSATQPAPPCGW